MTQPILRVQERDRLTPDLLHLHEQWPREAWPTSPIGSLARTWLSMHDSLREGQQMLERMATHWQLRLIDTTAFRARALPLLQQHLGHLHGHHRLEDTHYFPQFRRMQPLLVKGFDLLARDHADLHAAIDVLEGLTRRLASSDTGGPEAQDIARQLAEALHRIGPRMRQHLLDEEDLVIPLLAAAESHPGHPSP